jgi:hypothetical protein
MWRNVAPKLDHLPTARQDGLASQLCERSG